MALAGMGARVAEHVSVRRSRNRPVAAGSAWSRRWRAVRREVLVMDKGGMLSVGTSGSFCGWEVRSIVVGER